MNEKTLFKISTSTVTNEYEVKLPNVGQYRDIEVYKQILSNGMYSNLMQAGTVASQYALDVIDIEATLRVLCPKFIDDLKCEIRDLGIKDFHSVKKAYVEYIVPMLQEIDKLMKV